ncbi:hypothetical protein [Streptomyces sp. NPDC014006]|uniref:Vgb family protein n=1 Tax=Streptomyces sp. NPDC014006 TaxID=3364870 RepID=UPI00370353CE
MTRVSIDEYPVADSAAGPYALAAGADGALWFTLVHGGRIGRLVPGEEPTSHRLDPACGPTVITPGPDRALWFTEYRAHRIGRITVDGDGTAWFTEWGGNRVGAITPDGSLTVHGLPTPHSEPHGIAPGPVGALWTALKIGALARITPADGAP